MARQTVEDSFTFGSSLDSWALVGIMFSDLIIYIKNIQKSEQYMLYQWLETLT